MLQACVEQNVQRLVHTSTVDVVIGQKEIWNGDESLPPPRRFLFPGYPASKQQAERLVLEANGRKLANGQSQCVCMSCELLGELLGELLSELLG